MSNEADITVSKPSDDRQKDIITSNELNNSVRQPIPPPPQQEPVSGSVARQSNAVTESPQPQTTTPPPPLPQFDFSPKTGANDDIVQVMRNVATDIIKNITIDGVSPQISGSNIQFSTQNNQSASSQWAQQNQPPSSPNTGAAAQNTNPDLVPPMGGPKAVGQAAAEHQAAQNTNPDLVPSMGGPKAVGQAAAERQAEQEADNTKWGWNMAGPTSLKQAPIDRQAEQQSKDEEWGWSMSAPTATKGKIQREEAKEDAANYDIDTRGMSTRQIKAAVAEARAEDDAEQSEFESRYERMMSSRKKEEKDKKDGGDDSRGPNNVASDTRTQEKQRLSGKMDSFPEYKDAVELIPIWVGRADGEETERRIAYMVTASAPAITSDKLPCATPLTIQGGQNFKNSEYYVGFPPPPEDGYYVLGAEDGELKWILATLCE